MDGNWRPTYFFDFGIGIARAGVVRWSCPLIENGQLQRNLYRFVDSPLLSLGHPLSAELCDLLDVLAAIHIADRIALREIPGDPRAPDNRWHRELELKVPVRGPDVWRQPAVLDLLDDLLTLLTDDKWHLEFLLRMAEPRASEMQVSYFPPMAASVRVALHSGGLDSLYALATLAERFPTSFLIPVTVVSSSRVKLASKDVIKSLQHERPALSSTMHPIRPRMEVPRQNHARLNREPSQRARVGLFLAFGIGAAVQAGVDRLYVSENGIGAINLPMASDHWGARATKAMHPVTLHGFATLASTVLNRPIAIENLGLFLTKGEIVKRLRDDGLIEAIQATVTCDRFSYLGEACGRCSSCILRRVALVAAGIEDDSPAYRLDLLNPPGELAPEEAQHLLAMTFQVEKLRQAVTSDRAYAALDTAFPELFRVVGLAPHLGMTPELVVQRLVRLYRTYVTEFDAFRSRIIEPGRTSPAPIIQLPLTSGSHDVG